MRERPLYLHTVRLQLGPIRESDEADMLRIFLNPEVCKTYMIPAFRSDEEAVSLFHRFRELSVSGSRIVYGVYLQDRLIGFLNDVQRNGDSIEMGYVIHPDFQNNGYATEAFSAVILLLFSIGHTTVKADAFAENAASMRVMEKCGMEKTGEEETIFYRGIDHRCVRYAVSIDSPVVKKQAMDRVTWMEHCFDLLLHTSVTMPYACAGSWFMELLATLTRYYEGGQWMTDYMLDEAGYFPKNMKRGILSQDAIDHFLTQITESFL